MNDFLSNYIFYCRKHIGWNNTLGHSSRRCLICFALVMEDFRPKTWQTCGCQWCPWYQERLAMPYSLVMLRILFSLWILPEGNIEKGYAYSFFQFLHVILIFTLLYLFLLSGCLLVRTVFLVFFQSYVTHVVHRLRKVSPTITNGHVANHAFHDERGMLLLPVPWPRNKSHTQFGLLQKAVSWKSESICGLIVSLTRH